jgi:indoleamine 2,3-dioxygenase
MNTTLPRGFLPTTDPLSQLPRDFLAWEKIAKELPKLLITNQFISEIKKLPPFPLAKLKTKAQFERAMLIVSYLGHAYVWGTKTIPSSIQKQIAQPWYEIAKKLKRPPVLSYASYALHNWRRIDSAKPIELGNIVLLQNFLGGLDEEWFILVHVDIEAKAIPALNALIPAQQAALNKNNNALKKNLRIIVESLEKMCTTLDKMPKHCDPYIYYNRVRPYIHGWKDNPALPNGLIYEGVKAYKNKPQKFRGETGAQSSIIPSLDAAFGIQHQPDILRVYLEEMREYMPPNDRAFIEKIESGFSIRDYVISHRKQQPELREFYNIVIDLLERFRSTHLRYAAEYIFKQSQTNAANPTKTGTGGTPFMKYLKKHRNETSTFRI